MNNNKVIKTLILAAVLACTQAACTATANAGKLPEWITSPTPVTNQYMYGTGSASDFEQAKKHALSDIASQFNARVEESYSSFQKMDDMGFSQTTEIDTQVEVDATNLKHFTVSQTEFINQVYWVQIQLDRTKLAKDLSANWQANDQIIRQTMQSLNELSSLKKLLAIGPLQQQISLAQAQANQLSVADNKFSVNQHLQNYANALGQLTQYSQSLYVEVQDTSGNEKLKTWLESLLSKHNIQLKTQNSQAQSASVIKLESQLNTNYDDRDAIITELSVVIKSENEQGIRLGTAKYQSRGRDYNSESRAQDKAIESLKYQLKRQSLQQVLNIEK